MICRDLKKTEYRPSTIGIRYVLVAENANYNRQPTRDITLIFISRFFSQRKTDGLKKKKKRFAVIFKIAQYALHG